MAYFRSIEGLDGFFRKAYTRQGFFSVSNQTSFAETQRLAAQHKIFSAQSTLPWRESIDGARGSISGVAFGMSLGVEDILSLAIQQMSGDIQEAMKAFVQNSKQMRDYKGSWGGAMNRVGAGAQAAVLKSYDAQKKGPLYRVNVNRYAGRKLRVALASPTFYKADRDGLSFINTGMLNAKAKQWARYNYGALPRGRRESVNYPIKLYGTSLGKIGTTRGPSPSFMIPLGVFIGAKTRRPLTRSERGPRGRGSQDAFFTLAQIRGRKNYNSLSKEDKENAKNNRWRSGWFNINARDKNGNLKPRRQMSPEDIRHNRGIRDDGFFGPIESKGIVGRRVFDAGVEHIAVELPLQLQRLVETAFKDAAFGSRTGGFGPLGKQGLSQQDAFRHLNAIFNRY